MHPSEEVFTFQQCDGCQLVFLNPRVSLEKLKNYYTDFYLPYRGAAAWGKYENRVEASQQALDKKRASWVGQYYDVTKDTVLLDVGCGKPTFLKSCLQQYNCKTIGIDFTDEGWKGQAESYRGVELRVGEVDILTKEIQPNVITMWHYLEHDYDPLSTLKKLRDIAQPDTKLLIEVPNYDSESRKKYGAHWAGYHTPRHTFLFSPDNLSLLLKRAGWQTKKINTFGTLDPYVLYWMSEMEQKNIAWDKNMESEFFNYVLGLVAFLPKRINEKQKSLGIMTAIATLK
jgi:2-polyprenyl-3-methyl-5-hydroxy-6-metoxy-1,4-benzoquinol methylase